MAKLRLKGHFQFGLGSLAQLALLKLIKVRLGAFMSFTSEDRLMWMGRWSELKAVTVVQELQGRMDGEAKLMSGEELQCLVLRVGVSRLRMP